MISVVLLFQILMKVAIHVIEHTQCQNLVKTKPAKFFLCSLGRKISSMKSHYNRHKINSKGTKRNSGNVFLFSFFFFFFLK